MAASITNKPNPDFTKSLPVDISGMNAIRLRSCNLDAGCAQNLAKSIIENPSLSHLELDLNPLEDLGVEFISNAITGKTSLETLSINDVGMTSKGMLALADAVSTLNNLVILGVNTNPYGDAGVVELGRAITGKTSLTTLSLHSVGMTSKSVHELAQAIATLKNLTALDIRFNSIGDEGFIALSRSLDQTPLHSLYLTNIGITDSSMPSFKNALMKMSYLSDLVLHGAELTEEGFANLREGLAGKSLRILQPINKPGAAILFTGAIPEGISPSSNVGYVIQTFPPVDVSRMPSLNLTGCGITEHCFPALANLSSSIQELILDYNPLGDIGVGLLADALKNKAIKSLHLRGVGLTSAGMPALSETIASLGLPGTLAGLDLRENEIGDAGIISLSRALECGSKIHALLLSKTGMTDASMPTLCSTLSKMEHLNTLWIEGNDIVTEESFLWLKYGLNGRKMTYLHFDPRKESSVLWRPGVDTEAETDIESIAIRSSQLCSIQPE